LLEGPIAGISCLMISKTGKILIVAGLLLAVTGVRAANGDAAPAANLSPAQIVEQLQRHNQARTQALKHYSSMRHYQVEYRGFSRTIVARMDVEANYDAATGKSFRIVSQSGSKLLCEKVLKRAVESEKEAAQDQGATALTAANYKFHLAGTESLAGRPAYILDVEPLKESKFLYRGKIWVDAVDFALAKVDAEPAKNPSFWISRTRIQFSNAKRGDFWLPEKNRSETKVRIGGTAVLTIDYGSYQIS
jgi:hypothetical protein